MTCDEDLDQQFGREGLDERLSGGEYRGFRSYSERWSERMCSPPAREGHGWAAKPKTLRFRAYTVIVEIVTIVEKTIVIKATHKR